MSPRTALFGLIGAIGLAGAVAAEQPIKPLVEGREADLVAREFYQPDTPIGGYVAPPEPTGRSVTWFLLVSAVWDVMLDGFTVPLGTADMSIPDAADGA
jgi:hypothetical protein